jgi:hypothetical protein
MSPYLPFEGFHFFIFCHFYSTKPNKSFRRRESPATLLPEIPAGVPLGIPGVQNTTRVSGTPPGRRDLVPDQSNRISDL